ncbi:hypothetical protein POVCU2_0053020 [Plasmodium ovale curtisi]|uniref:Uncharacterized protein n=1 Tax=Plasmodium ovale curtisi TaxID=864141 RepID=A0A1A8W864_PLAOA|nr:hypothetical protein POVCU2_0053020 [Plasmodium ovale curtisi]
MFSSFSTSTSQGGTNKDIGWSKLFQEEITERKKKYGKGREGKEGEAKRERQNYTHAYCENNGFLRHATNGGRNTKGAYAQLEYLHKEKCSTELKCTLPPNPRKKKKKKKKKKENRV